MKNTFTYKATLGCMIALLSCTMSAQNMKSSRSTQSDISKTDKRLKNYNDLKKLGYKEAEIYEDLGNVHFLTEDYETAYFWYAKLITSAEGAKVSNSLKERYEYAQMKSGQEKTGNLPIDNKDWVASIKDDYMSRAKKEEQSKKFRALDFTQINNGSYMATAATTEIPNQRDFEILTGEKYNHQNAFQAPISFTADGKTAYFSKEVQEKPLYGMFSKKQGIHKIYRAEKVNGKWTNIAEVAVAPKNYSSKHPAISKDGKRLFFASNMPGTFGKYDIYVADIHRDGSVGVSKNLGEKVNTKKDDMHPSIAGNNGLFFASNGRDGFGGLDVYMVEVGQRSVGLAMNLGSDINSTKDDFSISFMKETGMAYVMSNRDNSSAPQPVAFSYSDKATERKEYNLKDAFKEASQIDYSNTVFEDE